MHKYVHPTDLYKRERWAGGEKKRRKERSREQNVFILCLSYFIREVKWQMHL